MITDHQRFGRKWSFLSKTRLLTIPPAADKVHLRRHNSLKHVRQREIGDADILFC